MREAYARGANAMEIAREYLGLAENASLATEISYDLQAGEYLRLARQDPESHRRWVTQLGWVLDRYLEPGDSVLEVGCGDGTTLSGILEVLPDPARRTFAVDLSWSRVHVASQHLRSVGQSVSLAAGDMFRLPFPDHSMDVVFTSHAIEPNGGRDEEALAELLRVARRYLVLFEPVYELAGPTAQERMRSHGYVRRLVSAARVADANLLEVRRLEYSANPQNPSGLIVLDPRSRQELNGEDGTVLKPDFVCPHTKTILTESTGCLYSASAGLAYPVIDEVPVLRPEYALVATSLGA